MADRYWVNDDTDNDANNANNWSATSGGSGGAGVPTSADDVYFDGVGTNSNTDCTTSADITCLSINFTASGYTSTFTISSGGTVTYGNEQNGGHCQGSYGNFDVYGTLACKGGFTYSGSFSANFTNSKIILAKNEEGDTAAGDFHAGFTVTDFEINNTYSYSSNQGIWDMNGTLTVTGTATFTYGRLRDGVSGKILMTGTGSVVIGPTYGGTTYIQSLTCPIEYSGSGVQTITATHCATGTINDTTPTTTIFETTLTGYGDDYFNGDLVWIGDKANSLDGRIISDYVSSTGEITVSSAFDFTPVDDQPLHIGGMHNDTIINKTGGSLTPQTDMLFSHDFTVTDGGETFAGNNKVAIFIGAVHASGSNNYSITCSESNITFYKVIIDNPQSYGGTGRGMFYITGTITTTDLWLIDGGLNNFSSGRFRFTGNLRVDDEWSVYGSAINNCPVEAYGSTATQYLDIDTLGEIWDMQINKSSGTALLNDTGRLYVGESVVFGDGASYGGLTITAGIFDINGCDVTIDNSYSCIDGAWFQLQGDEIVTFQNGAVWDTNSGGCTFNGSGTYDDFANQFGDTFYNLTLENATGIWDIAGTGVTVNGFATFYDGTFRMQGAETVTITGAYGKGSGTIEFDGVGTYANLPDVFGDDYYGLKFSGAGQWTMDIATDVTGAFEQSAGTVIAPSTTLHCNAGSGSMICTFSGGTFTHNNGIFKQTGDNTITGLPQLYNLETAGGGGGNQTLTFSGTGTINITDDLHIANTVISNLTLNGANIELHVKTDILIDGGAALGQVSGSATIYMDGTGDQVFNTDGGQIIPNLVINKAVSGNLTFTGTVNIINSFTFTALVGSFTTTGSTLVFYPDCVITGTFTVNNLTVQCNDWAGTAQFDYNGSGTLTVNGILTVTGSQAYRFQTDGTSTISCLGNVLFEPSGSENGNNNIIIEMAGSSTQTLTINNSAVLPRLEIDTSGTVVNVAGASDLTIEKSFDIVNGTIDLNGHNLTCQATCAFSNAAVLRLYGNETVAFNGTGGFDQSSGTVEFDGAVTADISTGFQTTGTFAFFDLVLNNAAGIWDINGADLTTNDDLVMTAGTLRMVGSETITISGIFTKGAGTVELDGTGTYTISIAFSNNFNSLKLSGDGVTFSFFNGSTTISDTFAANLIGGTIKFYADILHTISTWDVDGTSGNQVVLQLASGTPGTDQWDINVTTQNGGQSDYVTVSDSDASAGILMEPGTGAVDGNNNTNWNFAVAAKYWVEDGIAQDCVIAGVAQDLNLA